MTTISPTDRSRRLAWAAIGISAVTLLGVIARRVASGPVGWTSWALPLLIMANAVPTATGLSQTRPDLARRIAIGGIVVGLAILVSELRVLAHR